MLNALTRINVGLDNCVEIREKCYLYTLDG